MSGSFSRTALQFEDLEDDNSRQYWQAHKDVFEAEVRRPMTELVESLPAAYQPFRLFRMNRDLRFSHDKSPYKTAQGAIHESTKGIDHYLHIGADGLLVACGIYMLEPDQLERYRPAVDTARTGRQLERILADLAAQSVEINGNGVPVLKTAPRGFAKDHPRIELLRLKGVIGFRTLRGADLENQQTVHDFVIETFDACGALTRWLARHVGPAAGRHEPGR